MQVSESGYFAWKKRLESQRDRDDKRLKAHIRAIFQRSGKTYGSPRVLHDLRDVGEWVSKKRVARLMRQEGLSVKRPRRYRKTTDSRHHSPIAPNLVDRRFKELAQGPNRLWVSDITYVHTKEGWLYLCAFKDAYSRAIVGWAIEDHMEASLICEAFKMALRSRHVEKGQLIVHSDRGSQYASKDFAELLKIRDVKLSMSRAGDCWDNAMAESFWATIKAEFIDRCDFRTKDRARKAIGEWIEDFYNRQRRHSQIGYVAPVEYEILTRRSVLA
jgi:putative transposase